MLAAVALAAQHLGLKKFGVGLLVSWGHTGFASSCFTNVSSKTVLGNV